MADAALVPMQVDALVVDKNKSFLAPDKDDGTPFQDDEPIEPGVHLHWALPDALTRGAHEQPGDPFVRFPAVPDLWLVVRWNPPPVPAPQPAPGPVPAFKPRRI